MRDQHYSGDQVFEQNPTGFGLASWRRFGATLLDHVYPPTCVNCDRAIGIADSLCPTCWRLLRPITSPMCPRLGLPFEVSLGPDALCAEAIANPPPFDRARSAMVHNGVARKLISRLKFGDRPELAKFCARLMLSAGSQLLDKCGVSESAILVPVPLYRWRQWGRRYNQSCELARAMARLGGMEMMTSLVRRIRPTARQIGLNSRQRVKNVAGAFMAVDDILEVTGGRPVVLIDDVITTGSTVNAVTRALQKKGVTHIDVISFSRVVFGDDDAI